MELLSLALGIYRPGADAGLEQPITEQCTTRKMTMVPIRFEPTSDSPLPVSFNCPKFEMVVVLGCAERYICQSAVPACPAFGLKKRPIYLLCATCLNVMVPIRFQPKLNGRWAS